ncbi:LOW QUALITY PROTEIN: anoctamin-8 [Gracilinanus agilis]|uniref:LOW QUALITY PROTEIN: anoctamin-8 n=1 Tax=Gracilinanus agilis TaxID=191870 RepID=UPI001CFC5D0A|nr:LOW QUALITY PROTEIN: anoctamin-8 [Gracilinanus agilis]
MGRGNKGKRLKREKEGFLFDDRSADGAPAWVVAGCVILKSHFAVSLQTVKLYLQVYSYTHGPHPDILMYNCWIQDWNPGFRSPCPAVVLGPSDPLPSLFPDKLFGKRLLQAGRYIMSHKSWMKTVPTENCDVLMTFPDTTDDHTLLWLLNHIRVGIPELIVQVRHHRHTRTYGFFLTATYESLLRGADELGLRKAVKAEFGGGTRGFSCEEDFIYENVESELRFFTSQERQSIIRFWLENLRAKAGEALHNVRFLEDQPISVPQRAGRGACPENDWPESRRALKGGEPNDWRGLRLKVTLVNWGGLPSTGCSPSPPHFSPGPGPFQRCLVLPQMLATLLITRQFLQNIREVLQPHLYRRLTSGDLSARTLWEFSKTFLQLLTHRPPAPEARPREPLAGPPEPRAQEAGGGGGRKCLNGGCGVPEEEEEERRRRAGEGGEEAGGGGGGEEEDEEEEEEDEEEEEEEESLLDCGLKLRKVSFAERAERQRRAGPTGPENFLEEGSPTMVDKGLDPAAVFALCEDEEDAEEPSDSPGREPLGAPGGLRGERPGGEGRDQGTGEEEAEASGPGEDKRKKANRTSWIDPPEEDYSPQLTQAELESCMKKYEDPFQDYQEMFVQFGYVVLFSSAFPLAALCALVNNLIEIRSDAFKLCTGLQRPFGQRVDSIGQWQKVMEAMGILAIVVNCYLIGQCGQLQRLFPWLSPEAAIISVVVLEHFALFLKYLIQAAIPDIPAWVAEEMAKLEHQRREAFKKHERQAQHHYQQQQRRRREEEERQRHAEHHARREREAGREEGRAEGSGPDLAPEKAPAKAKGGPGPDRPKRPGSLLAPNNVMKLKHMIPLQGKFLSSSSSSSSSAGGAGPATRQPQAPSPTGDTRLPAFLSFKFLKSPEAKRDQERSHSPPKPFHAGKLFPFGGRAESTPASNGAGGGQVRPDSAPSKAQRPGLADEAGGEEPDARAEDEGSGTAQPASGVPSRAHRRSPAPPRRSCPPSPNTPPPTGCWQWEGPWSCGGEGGATRGEGYGPECPPCARAPGSPAWVPAPLPVPPAQGEDSFSSPPLPGPYPLPPADSPSPSPSPQAICWPAGWH